MTKAIVIVTTVLLALVALDALAHAKEFDETNNGCEIECPCEEHPDTAIVTCPVPRPCPHEDGVARAVVYDYTTKPPKGEGKPETRHVLKSISPCGCVRKCLVCQCIPCGEYEGVCRAYKTKDCKGDKPDASTCTYEIRCKEVTK